MNYPGSIRRHFGHALLIGCPRLDFSVVLFDDASYLLLRSRSSRLRVQISGSSVFYGHRRLEPYTALRFQEEIKEYRLRPTSMLSRHASATSCVQSAKGQYHVALS